MPADISGNKLAGLPTSPPMKAVLRRGLAHLLVGSACVATIWLAPHWTCLSLLGAGLALFTLLDILRIQNSAWFQPLAGFYRLFLRTSEECSLSGASYLLAGAFLTALVFEKPLALTALLFLTFGDLAATLFGTWRGGGRQGKKSLGGSLACLAACLVVAAAVYLSTGNIKAPALAGGVFSAVLLEALPWKLNDNLSLPLGSAAVMLGISRLLG